MKIHDLRHLDNGMAYDRTQTADSIKDRDVFITATTIGVLMDAWPIAIAGDPKEFDSLRPDSLEKVRKSVELAKTIKDFKDFKQIFEEI